MARANRSAAWRSPWRKSLGLNLVDVRLPLAMVAEIRLPLGEMKDSVDTLHGKLSGEKKRGNSRAKSTPGGSAPHCGQAFSVVRRNRRPPPYSR